MRNTTLRPKYSRGFSLVELAVVLVILGFVIGALLLPLQAQREQLFRNQTESQLETAKRALLGFAQTNGRLPCPATALNDTDPGSAGLEQPIGGGTCMTQVGFLPSATLGLQPTDINGFAVDAWNNRIVYAVAQSNSDGAASADFTTLIADDPSTPANEADGMNVVGIAKLAPELRICNSATGLTPTQCSVSPETNYAANNAVAIVFSRGSTAPQGAGDADEVANLDSDPVFVSHSPTPTFDHLVVWISPYVLYEAMIRAGQLH